MSEFPPVRKAVFPVAGLGTRFLPATKAIPKEMLPIVDKPLIQFAVEEAADAGIESIIFVINRSKRAILDHFAAADELHASLLALGKEKLAASIGDIKPDGVEIQHVFQEQVLGLGHAVWCARELVGDEPFAVILADDLIRSQERSCLQQMVEVYAATGAAVIGVEEIPAARTDRYGIVSVEMDASGRDHIQAIVEKPAPWDAPSNLGVVGRYILPPEIFSLLESVRAGVGGEIQLTDAIAALLSKQPVLAHAFSGIRYDCGSRQGFIRAIVDYALEHAELRADLVSHFKRARKR